MINATVYKTFIFNDELYLKLSFSNKNFNNVQIDYSIQANNSNSKLMQRFCWKSKPKIFIIKDKDCKILPNIVIAKEILSLQHPSKFLKSLPISYSSIVFIERAIFDKKD